MAAISSQLCRVAVLLLSLAAAAGAHAAESLQLVEQEIKAGLLYNFLKYTDWPQGAAANAPMIVCLLGGDPFGGRLQSMAGRTVNQRVIEVRTVAAVADAAACSLVFIHANEKPRWPQLHQALIARAMLTVSDFPGFSDSGGMIEFTRVDNRIGVKINTSAVATAHLQVQDRLLKLASADRGAGGR